MPAWENVLEEEGIDAVAKYVFENATAGTWASQ
jgi:mono/diheme cytochrome c family protein